MTHPLFHHIIFCISALLDCILGAHLPFVAFFTLHIAIFRYGLSFNLPTLIVLGLFLDAYTSPFLGIQSLFFITALWFFQKMALWTKKTENFWYIWASFALIAIIFYCIDHSFRFESSLFSKASLLNRTALLGYFLISIHPIFFYALGKQGTKFGSHSS